MAGTTTKKINEPKLSGEMVKITLPRNPDPKAPQEEFYSLNFKNYLIKRGVAVEIPKELYDMIMDNQAAEEEAIQYEDEQVLKA